MLSINCKGRLLAFDTPIVMGIINATPDSFYSGSRVQLEKEIVSKAENMLLEGAAILDIGGQSTRPGSERISPDAELKRVMPAIEAIVRRFPDAILSIDTFYAKVAKEAVEAGASVVNDVSAGKFDDGLLELVARLGVPYVAMHMKGDPQHMQQAAIYDNVTLDVFDFLNHTIYHLQHKGIKDIIIDPGFGFAKTTGHNLELLQNLSYLKQLGKPILIGLSRKATVYKTLNVSPQEALNGTTVLNTIALLNGAHILRVHDVKEAVETIRLVSACQQKRATV